MDKEVGQRIMQKVLVCGCVMLWAPGKVLAKRMLELNRKIKQ